MTRPRQPTRVDPTPRCKRCAETPNSARRCVRHSRQPATSCPPNNFTKCWATTPLRWPRSIERCRRSRNWAISIPSCAEVKPPIVPVPRNIIITSSVWDATRRSKSRRMKSKTGRDGSRRLIVMNSSVMSWNSVADARTAETAPDCIKPEYRVILRSWAHRALLCASFWKQAERADK